MKHPPRLPPIMLFESRARNHAKTPPAPDAEEAYRQLQRRLFAEAVEDAACTLGDAYQKTGYGLRSPDALLAIATAYFAARCPTYEGWRDRTP